MLQDSPDESGVEPRESQAPRGSDAADPSTRAARGALDAGEGTPPTAARPDSSPQAGRGETGDSGESASDSERRVVGQPAPEATHGGTIRLSDPDGSFNQLEPDGTNTFTSPDGSSVSVRPGGPVVASAGVDLHATPGGDFEARTKDGYVVTASQQGDLWVRAPDGGTRGIGRDSTISISDGEGWSVVSSSDGTKSTTTVRAPDGSILATDSDGTRSVGRPDGSQTTYHPDGTIVHTSPDFTTTVTEPDGTTRTTTPDGTTEIREADGDLYYEYPDGTMTGPVVNEPGLESEDPLVKIGVGALEASRDIVELGWSISPLRRMIDPEGWNRTVEGMASGLWYGVNHPVEFAKAAIDLDTWREDPLRAMGHLVPGILAAAAGAGMAAAASKLEATAGAAATKLEETAAIAASRLEGAAAAGGRLEDVAGAASTLEDFAEQGLTRGPDGVWRQANLGDDIGEGLTVREGRAMDRTAAPKPSETLGAALRASGEQPPGPGYEAHHIIPTNEGGAALDPIREAARDALAGSGKLDSARNGVWLPENQEVANEAGGVLHMDYLHSNGDLYAAEIRARFTGPDGAPLRGDRFLERLDQVKAEMLDGLFRIRF
jgi:hypothetical protein